MQTTTKNQTVMDTVIVGYPVRPCTGCEHGEHCASFVSTPGCSTFQMWQEYRKQYVAEMREMVAEGKRLYVVYSKVIHCHEGRRYHVSESVLITDSSYDATFAVREMENDIREKQEQCPEDYTIEVVRTPWVTPVEKLSEDIQYEIKRALEDGRYWCGADDNYYEVDEEKLRGE